MNRLAGRQPRRLEPHAAPRYLACLVADAEVDVEGDKCAAIETRIHWKPGAAFRSPVERRHRLADDKREEVGKAKPAAMIGPVPERCRAWAGRLLRTAPTLTTGIPLTRGAETPLMLPIVPRASL